MNIVYGGSFNPPTIAHVKIINKLRTIYKPDRFIILPVGNNYAKDFLVDFNYRFEMSKIAFREYDDVIILDIENTKEYKGTFDSLEKLSKQYDDLVYVVGEDHLSTLKTWINYQALLLKYPIIVISRNHASLNEDLNAILKGSVGRIDYIPFNMNVSSSEARNDIIKRKKFCDPEVLKYIDKNKLYEV